MESFTYLLIVWPCDRKWLPVWLFGCPQKHAARLQCVQQALARVVMQQSSVSPLTSTEHLKQLHWLPIEWRIRFKLACLVHKIRNTGHPPYLTKLIQYHKPSRSTRSSASHLLSVLRHNLSFGARAFRVAAPKIWNSIPLHIRQSQTYSSFRRHLKTYTTFFQPISPPSGPCNAPWFSSEILFRDFGTI